MKEEVLTHPPWGLENNGKCVGRLEGGTTIRTFASDTNDFTERAEGFNENLLVLRGRPGQVPETGDDLEALLWVESTENRTVHDDTTSGVDSALSGDRASGEDVIPSTHLDGYTGVVAVGDGVTDARTKGVFDTGDGHQSHVVKEVFI